MGSKASTGIPGLDAILHHLLLGDNVVWQVDGIEDYRFFVQPYVRCALEQKRKLVYFRFASHPPLLEPHPAILTVTLDATSGFETFSSQIHQVISQQGVGTFYVFDCLSDLLSAWATDLMIGNFFMVTCPYLFELDTVAYFALLRDRHDFHTIARIRETTQVLLDVYHVEDRLYVHPLKVWNRYSPTMFLPHRLKNETFVPLTSSVEASKLLGHIWQKSAATSTRRLDYWEKLFLEAQQALDGGLPPAQQQVLVEHLCRIMVAREKRICALAAKTLTLADLLEIKNRLVGSGFIGGKAAGMLIARRILNNQSDQWAEMLEPHDSFYIGSDVFYTYIVENGWWKLFMRQKTPEGYFQAAEQLREKMLTGRFSEPIRQRFQEIVEYFGQSPIIVRSSSLLEDSFGNAFAGKYESIFLVNQCSPDERYQQFEAAVRRIFASVMSKDALTYRQQRGLAQMDEQMALLVQRVSGSYHGHYFFPDMAGVGVSYNTFVWRPHLDPKAGMIRLVYGLGTRAVNRVEDDYPQTIALDDPMLRPYAGRKDAQRFSQRRIDLLDTDANQLQHLDINDLLREVPNAACLWALTRDADAEAQLRHMGKTHPVWWRVDFKRLLTETDFIDKMRHMLQTLQTAYDYPVDIEFTINFEQDSTYHINLVQCRPLQTKGLRANVKWPQTIGQDQIIIATAGHTMGGSICQSLACLVYVDAAGYVALPQTQKYELARLIGKLNQHISDRQTFPTLLIGPGRWGTSTPSLGVPVSFSEINRVIGIVEVAYELQNLAPDLSFGSHFFQDLVESDIFYLAVFPQADNTVFKKEFFYTAPNALSQLVPDSHLFEDVVRVWVKQDNDIQLVSDMISQKTLLFINR